MEMKAGKYAEAKKLFESGPFDASLDQAYGEYLVRSGRINDAREVLEKGLEINPTHAPLYHSLAELEARVFNVEGLAKLSNLRYATINSITRFLRTLTFSKISPILA